jgi:hypothetical protein
VRRQIVAVDKNQDWLNPLVCDKCATEAVTRENAYWSNRLRLGDYRWRRKTKRRSHCQRCSKAFWFNRGIQWPPHCPKCAARIRACKACGATFETDDATKECCSVVCSWKHDAQQWWLTLPMRYQETRLDRLPDPVASEKLLSWEGYDIPGVFAFGPSGSGKTRTAQLRLRRFIESGLDAMYLRSAEFARELIERTKPGGKGGADAWLTSLRRVDVLCLDEVEKLKFSERVQVEFFDLVEVRLSDDLTTLFVGNENPKELAERMGHEFSDAFFRRVCEFCTPMKFTKPKR